MNERRVGGSGGPHDGRPRLLLVVPWFSLGGSDRFNLNLIEQLAGHGWAVTVVSTLPHADDWLTEYQARSPDVIALHRHVELEEYPESLADLIRSRGIETVIVSHSELGYRLLPFLRALFPGLTVLDYVHVVDPTFHRGGFPRYSIDYQEHIDLSVAASGQVRDWMIERGMRPDRVDVCHINVDTDRFRPDADARAAVRSGLRVPDDAVIALFAGRLSAQKQPDVLAEALVAFLQRVPHARAWIVGDGPDRAALDVPIQRHGAGGRVQMLGAVLPDGIAQLMAGADLLFLPSRFEGIANVLFEAMACGLPVVGADVGGQRELVTSDCGVLIEPRSRRADIRRYVDALTALARDADRRQRLGAAGRVRVTTHFGIDAMGQRMVGFIARARARRANEPRRPPDGGLATAVASEVIDFTRRTWLGERLRRERRGETAFQQAYVYLNRWLAPVYEWGVARGWTWFPWLGERIRWLLLRKG